MGGGGYPLLPLRNFHSIFGEILSNIAQGYGYVSVTGVLNPYLNGKSVAKNITEKVNEKGDTPPPFHFRDWGF